MEFLKSFFYNPDDVIATIMVMSLLFGFNKKFVVSEQKIFRNFNNILFIYFFGSTFFIAFIDPDLPLSKSASFVVFVILYAKGCNFAVKIIKKIFKKNKKTIITK